MEITKILLADDGLEAREAIFHHLKDRYSILLFFANSVDDLSKEPFLSSSLAIIDSGFANNLGLKALNELKASKPSLPIIFTTHQGREELGFNAFKLGARDCFIKPFIIADLIQSIELILSCGKEENENRSNVLLDKYGDSFVVETAIQNNDPAIEKAKKYIEENFKKAFSLEHLAQIACKSKYHFCRIFKKQTGVTCSGYLNGVRVREAKDLLKNNQLSIKEVCHHVGYKYLPLH